MTTSTTSVASTTNSAAGSSSSGSCGGGGVGSSAVIQRRGSSSSGLVTPVGMSVLETEAELRTKELLDAGTITQEEYEFIVAKTRQRR